MKVLLIKLRYMILFLFSSDFVIVVKNGKNMRAKTRANIKLAKFALEHVMEGIEDHVESENAVNAARRLANGGDL